MPLRRRYQINTRRQKAKRPRHRRCALVLFALGLWLAERSLDVAGWQEKALALWLMFVAGTAILSAVLLIFVDARLLHVPNYSEPLTHRPKVNSVRSAIRILVEWRVLRVSYFLAVLFAMLSLMGLGVFLNRPILTLFGFMLALVGMVPSAIIDGLFGDPARIRNTGSAKWIYRLRQTLMELTRDD